jgi:hypothetical protein
MTSNQIARQQLLEDRRANMARERENERSNKAKEAENYRSNVTKEVETERHNREDEYGKLIRATNNPFSLISHAAGGSGNAVTGTGNILRSLFSTDSGATKDPSRRKKKGESKDVSIQSQNKYHSSTPQSYNKKGAYDELGSQIQESIK